MGYLFLLLTIIAESVAVLCMKLSDGFRDKLQTGIAIIAYLLGFVFLTLALRQLPVGFANAIWAGASTILIAVLGAIIFKEQFNVLQLVFLGLIVIGLVGLHLTRSVE